MLTHIKSTFLLISLLVASVQTGCSSKKAYVCGLEDQYLVPRLESKIIRLQRTAIVDTTLSNISGAVFASDTSTYVLSDTLVAAAISAVDKTSSNTYTVLSGIDGRFSLNIPASTYNLKVQSFAYNAVVVYDVVAGPGDRLVFDVVLGNGHPNPDSTVYIMQADRSINVIKAPIKKK